MSQRKSVPVSEHRYLEMKVEEELMYNELLDELHSVFQSISDKHHCILLSDDASNGA